MSAPPYAHKHAPGRQPYGAHTQAHRHRRMHVTSITVISRNGPHMVLVVMTTQPFWTQPFWIPVSSAKPKLHCGHVSDRWVAPTYATTPLSCLIPYTSGSSYVHGWLMIQLILVSCMLTWRTESCHSSFHVMIVYTTIATHNTNQSTRTEWGCLCNITWASLTLHMSCIQKY